MFDAKQILDELVYHDPAGGRLGAALTRTNTGNETGGFAGTPMRLSGLALVACLASEALHKRLHRPAAGRRTAAPAIPVGSALFPDSSNTEGTKALSLLLARAIISAEKADGQVDADDGKKILHRVNSLDLPPAAKVFLIEEYSKPVDLEELTAAIDSEEHATEVYTASLLSVDPKSPAGREYLYSLEGALDLEPGLVMEIHAAVHCQQAAA